MDQDVVLIVMITQLVEDGRIKADRYWPSRPGERLRLDNGMSVKFNSEIEVDGLYKRSFSVEFNGIMQNVEQIQCVLWPDGGSPSSTSVLLDLIHHSNEVLDDQAGTIIVHCSAGVGRTGTFIGLYKLIKDFLDDEVKILDPFETVLEMRKQRMKMVQKPMQYHYMIKCLADFVAEESTEVVYV